MAICKWRDMSAEADGGRKITNENIASIIAYNTRDSKTEDGKYIYCHKCNHELLGTDFISSTMERELYNNRSNINHPYDEFYISWGKEITAEKAFELSQAIAEEYLGEDYQYMITTHVDRDHIHSHFLFNCANLRTHKMFDHTRSHRIQFLRDINDRIAQENGLSVIETNQRRKTISLGEYYSQKHQRSFKYKAKLLIDRIIMESDDYNDFLQRLSAECLLDCSRKYTKIKLKGMKEYIRFKALGADYYEHSIIYRIEHKDPGFIRHPHFKYYDLNEKKFQNQIGLRNWAIHQNIALSFEQAKALDEIRNLTSKQSLHDQLDNLYEQTGNLQKEISILDAEIYHLQNNVLTAILEYPRYYAALIKPYKQLPTPEEKEAYKHSHYMQFKRYDQITSFLKPYKDPSTRKYLSKEIAEKMIETLSDIRNSIYERYTSLNKEIIYIQYLKSADINAISQQEKEKVDSLILTTIKPDIQR